MIPDADIARILPLVTTMTSLLAELGVGKQRAQQVEQELQKTVQSMEAVVQRLQLNEDRLYRANRSLKLLSASNRSLLRATDEQALLEEVCRIAVEIGEYSFSWVGYKESSTEQLVRPAAYCGHEAGFLTQAPRMSWGDNQYGQSAMSTAMRTDTTQLRQNILNDSRLAPWHEDARRRNYQSAIALPLHVDGEVIGAIAIYAAEPYAFGTEEIKLFEDLARDLSFGITNIRLRTAHEHAAKRIEQLAFFDSLTGLPNRNYLADLLKHAVTEGAEQEQQFAVCMLDLDYIHEINETHGHETGDTILIQTAAKITELVGNDGVVTRFGGDDFVVILRPAGQMQAVELSEKLLEAIRQPLTCDDHAFSLRGSIGIAIYPNDADNPKELLARADLAMSKAKALGGGYLFYSHEMTQELFRRLSLAHRLEYALPDNHLQLWYQPKIDLETGATVGAEALLRWNDPVLGAVSPAEFITLAEDRGLMPVIGEWIFKTVCEQMLRWQQQGVPCVGKIAINVSAKQFDDLYFLERVERIFLQSGVSPSCVELELTESCLMHNPEQIVEVMSSLRWLGFSLAIDDFGTGYSSLSHLKRFPINTLKIDRSFVKYLTTDQNDKAIVATILAIAAQLELDTVAEGVETQEQHQLLLELGCRLAQGYYFSRPIPVEAFTERVLQNVEA